MKYLRTNIDNTIHLIADKKLPDTQPFTGKLPHDFYNTFSKGKYLLIDGELVVNSAWSEENGELIELPTDIPHRSLLIEAGISGLRELSDIQDLTSISGIGQVKAEEINNYITTNGA